MATVGIDDLAAAVVKELTEYSQDVTDGLKKRSSRWRRSASRKYSRIALC